MNFNKPKHRNPLLIAGLLCLVLANLSHSLVLRLLHVDPDAADLVFGLLMGAAIGLLLLAVRRSCQQKRKVDSSYTLSRAVN